MIHDTFDPERNAVINPHAEKIAKMAGGVPEVCLGVFSDTIVKHFVREYAGEKTGDFESVTGNRNCYRVNIFGMDVLLFVPIVGAPAAAAMLEDMIWAGCRYFVFLGCCGVLRHDIADGHIILPTAAVRDEGLSYHYVPAAEEIEQDERSIKAMREAMETLQLPYVEAKTWTTDAIYRETPKKVKAMRDRGCVCVEMECAALTAVAQFRGVPFAQFLWSADNLDAPEWEKRGLHTRGEGSAELYMRAAVETAKNLKKYDSQ